MELEDTIRLEHMIDTCEKLERFTAGRTRDDLEHDEILLLALVKLLEILGEAASKVSEKTRAAGPDIPWRVIKDMRNRLSHAYFDIDASIVWETASHRVPGLLPALRALLAQH